MSAIFFLGKNSKEGGRGRGGGRGHVLPVPPPPFPSKSASEILEATLESGLCAADEHALTSAVDQASTSRGKYKIYRDEERYKIDKYTSEHEPVAAIRKSKSKFPKLNETTCRSIKKKYEKELNMAKHKQ